MHIWDGLWEVLGISDHSTGHRSRPRLDICNSEHEVTHLCEGGSNAERAPCNLQLFHQSVHGQVHAIFSSLKDGDDFCWNEECEKSFQGLKKYLASPPLLSKPSLGETLISLSRGLRVSGEQSPSSKRWGYLEANVLRQSFHEQPTDQIPKAREAGACSLHYFKEAQALFSNLLDHSSHWAPPKKCHRKPRSNWENFEVGLKSKILRTQIRAKDSDQRPGLSQLHCWLHLGGNRSCWTTRRVDPECEWSFKQ